jgi:hypothetical protein
VNAKFVYLLGADVICAHVFLTSLTHQDIDVINLELALADLSVIEKRLERLKKGACPVACTYAC